VFILRICILEAAYLQKFSFCVKLNTDAIRSLNDKRNILMQRILRIVIKSMHLISQLMHF